MSVEKSKRIAEFRLDVELLESDLWFVTSPDIKGLFLAHRDFNAILSDLPDSVGGLSLVNHNNEILAERLLTKEDRKKWDDLRRH